MLLYSDNHAGKYCLIDYNQSHGQMLFRKFDADFYVDILFKGSYSFNIRTEFVGINIYVVEFEEGQICEKKTTEKFVFKVIDADGNTSFFGASAFGFYHTKLSASLPHSIETGLGRFGMSENSRLIYWSKDDVKTRLKNIDIH